MSDNRLWLLDRKRGLAARIATFYGYKWEVNPDVKENLQVLFDRVDDPEDECAGDSEVEGLELIWEGDGKGWQYSEPHGTFPLRRIIGEQ